MHYTLHQMDNNPQTSKLNMCEFEKDLSNQDDSDNQADDQSLIDEAGIDKLILNGVYKFSCGDIALYKPINKAFETEPELFKSLFQRVVAGDLTAIKDMRLLIIGITKELILEMTELSR